MAEKLTFQATVERKPVSDGTPDKTKLASKTSSEDSIWTRMIHTPKSEKLSFKNYATKVEVLEDTPKKSDWNPSTPERKWYRSLLTGNDYVFDRSAIDQDIDEKIEIQKSDADSNVEEKLSVRKSSGKVGFVEDPKEPKAEVPSEDKKWSSISWFFGSKTDRDAEINSAKKLTRRGATRRKPIIVEVDDDHEDTPHSEKKITVEVVEHTVIPSPEFAGKSKEAKLQESKIKIDQDEKKKGKIEESTKDEVDSQSKIRKWLCCYTTTKSTNVKSLSKETEEPKEAIDKNNKTDKIEDATENEDESQSMLGKLLSCCCCTPAKSNEVKSMTKETEALKEAAEPQVKPKWELKEEFRQVTTDKIYVKVNA